MTRVAAYVRISQDFEGSGSSIATQKRKITALAESRDWTVVRTFEDNSVSASKQRGKGTAWDDMVAAASKGNFDVVVAVDMDRLLRNMADFVTLTETGVNVVTVDGEIDLSTADGEFRGTMLTGIARFEVRRKAERTRRGNERRRAEGMPAKTGKQPFAYTSDGLELIEDEAIVVRRVFADFLADVPIRRLTKGLNDARLTTARGTQWSTDAVRYMLANARYAGQIRYYETGELFPGNFPAVISMDTWHAAQRKLADPARRTTTPGNQPKYLLSGVARCGKCGATMQSGKNDRKVPNYRCSVNFHVTRQREPVDALVNMAVIEILSAPNARELFAPPEVQGVDRDALRSERIVLQSRLTDLAGLLADGILDAAAVRSNSARLKQRISEIDGALAIPADSPVLELVDAEDVAVAWWDLDMDRRRMVVDAIMTVTIDPAQRGVRKFDAGKIRIGAKGLERAEL